MTLLRMMRLPVLELNHSENVAHLSVRAAVLCISAIQHQTHFAKTPSKIAFKMACGLGPILAEKTS